MFKKNYLEPLKNYLEPLTNYLEPLNPHSSTRDTNFKFYIWNVTKFFKRSRLKDDHDYDDYDNDDCDGADDDDEDDD